jgi:hypothetical protein
VPHIENQKEKPSFLKKRSKRLLFSAAAAFVKANAKGYVATWRRIDHFAFKPL